MFQVFSLFVLFLGDLKQTKKHCVSEHTIPYVANPSCLYDNVEIREGGDEESPLVGRYCGTEIPPPYVSDGNTLLVHFRSDYSRAGQGFRAKYELVCDAEYTEPEGEFSSPFFPDAYPAGRDCVYKIAQVWTLAQQH